MGTTLKSHLDQRIKTNRSNTHIRERHNSVTKSPAVLYRAYAKGSSGGVGALETLARADLGCTLDEIERKLPPSVAEAQRKNSILCRSAGESS